MLSRLIGQNSNRERQLILILRKQTFTYSVIESNGTISTTEEKEWQAKTLATLLTSIKETTGCPSIRLLIDANLGLVFPLIVHANQKNVDQAVLSLASEQLPDEVESLGIDHTFVSANETNNLYQIFAVKKTFLSLIGRSAQKAELQVLSVGPVATAITNLTKRISKPHIIVWQDKQPQVIAVVQHKAVMAKAIDDVDVYKSVESLLSSVSEKTGEVFSTLVLASSLPASMKNKLNKLADDTSEQELDPFAGEMENDEFAFDFDADQTKEKKSVVSEPDPEETMAGVSEDIEPEVIETKESIIKPVSAPTPPLKMIEQTPEKPIMTRTPVSNNPQPKRGVNAKLIVILITVLVLLSGIVGGGLLVYQNAMSNQDTEPEVIESTEPTPVPEQPTATTEPSAEASDSAEVDSSAVSKDISIQVLNGSGTPGEAGKVSDLLEAEDFADIDTANAKTFDFTETEIQVKPGKKVVYETIAGIVKEKYSVTQGDDLDEDSKYDVIITVGKE